MAPPMVTKSEKPKSKAGRKPKPESERHGVQFMVRLTPEQNRMLEDIADARTKATGMKVERSSALRYAVEMAHKLVR